MSNNSLRDLDLAGVRWELTDIPLTAMRKSDENTISHSGNSGSVSSAAMVDIGRIATSVVPPVAPVQTISVETVRAMASRPNDISALNRMIGEFNHPLRAGATNTVLPHVGQGGLLVLTDIPSSDDDACGVILSGAAGELMDKMLAAIGLSRENVSIMPLVFWRTPGGRSPSRVELDLSRPFVDKVIELLSPRVILTLGTLAATELANINIAKSHGVPVILENGSTLMPIYHPNYLMLKPAAKRDVWTALQNVQNILKSAE